MLANTRFGANDPRRGAKGSVWLAIVVAMAACATSSDGGPSEQQLDDLDQWSATADGKADLPDTWSGTVAWVRDFYKNRMSAIWDNQEHPSTPAAALSRIRSLVGTPDALRFVTHVRRLHADLVDHSEVDIELPSGRTVRLVGDPKGAGVFFDGTPFEDPIGPPLCLTWSEVETAVNASYVGGDYAVDYVCHTVTERVLRALGVGSAPYSTQIHTYAAARWIWGPIVPSGNPQNPSSWPESRSCD